MLGWPYALWLLISLPFFLNFVANVLQALDVSHKPVTQAVLESGGQGGGGGGVEKEKEEKKVG